MSEVPHRVVNIDARRIVDWGTLHDEFSSAFGFPSFYGRNMNAWIDCMTYLDSPSDGMSKVHAPPGGVLVLQIDHAGELSTRNRKIYDALIQSSAFVNWRRLESGDSPVLVLSFHE